MKKNRLMSPGPTPVPGKTLLRMADKLIHHRTPRFRSVLRGVHHKLKKLFRTNYPVIILASSGTGAMEASVVNFLSYGDKVLVVNAGKFGERFGVICRAFGVEYTEYTVEWGDCPDPAVIRDLLDSEPEVKAVYCTLCETSTGVLSDIKAIGEVVRETEAILVVDAISGLSADELCADEWGVDVVVCGSQKGLMLPPGLGFLSVSPKARVLAERSDIPKYYFSINEALKAYQQDDTPWTPAISLIMGLDSVLDSMMEQGPDAALAQYSSLSEACREGVKAMGLKVFSSRPSNAVTAVKVPDGLDGNIFVRKLRDEEGITVAGGQGDLNGKIFRIGHLGHVDEYDVITVLAGVERVLFRMGYPVEFGKGVGRAMEILSGDKVKGRR